MDAMEEYQARVLPAWKRALEHEGSVHATSPVGIQAKFEHDAIVKEARRLYHRRLLGFHD